jgi:hypothetical protein
MVISRLCAAKICISTVSAAWAGDMFLGACLDLGMPAAVVAEAVASLKLHGIGIEARKAARGGFAGTRFRVLDHGRPIEGPDPEERDPESSVDPEAEKLSENGGGDRRGEVAGHSHSHPHPHTHPHAHPHSPADSRRDDAGSTAAGPAHERAAHPLYQQAFSAAPPGRDAGHGARPWAWT